MCLPAHHYDPSPFAAKVGEILHTAHMFPRDPVPDMKGRKYQGSNAVTLNSLLIPLS